MKMICKALLLVSFAGTASAGTIYDIVAGFSTTNNPNGVWAYDYLDGSLFTNTAGFNGQTAWVTGGGNATTATSITGNLSGSAINAATVTVPGNALNLNPQGSQVEVVFTAPALGSYAIAGVFLGDDSSEVSHAASIFDNSTAIVSDTISSFNQSTSFNVTETLNAGDKITFLVTSPNGVMQNLSTGLQATITQSAAPPAPEPATLVLFGAGLVFVCLRRLSRQPPV